GLGDSHNTHESAVYGASSQRKDACMARTYCDSRDAGLLHVRWRRVHRAVIRSGQGGTCEGTSQLGNKRPRS
ncbi:unnamed protein product, partial [Ectocarpus sp. 12 AP-2014]